MAALQPVDAGQLLRKLTADIGRPPTPADVQLLASALSHIGEGIVADTHPPQLISYGPLQREQGYCVTSSMELAQLARQLLQTAGLAEAVQEAAQEAQEARPVVCGSYARGDGGIVACQLLAGHGGLHVRGAWHWSDQDRCVIGF